MQRELGKKADVGVDVWEDPSRKPLFSAQKVQLLMFLFELKLNIIARVFQPALNPEWKSSSPATEPKPKCTSLSWGSWPISSGG